MKRLLLVFAMLMAWMGTMAQDTLTDFGKMLMALDGVSGVEQLACRGFKEKYVLYIEQPISKNNPSLGTFKQRVVVGLKGLDRPTVIVTEGYSADYALYPNYKEELSELMNANVVFCEYRYFKKSTPDPCNWNYMLIENSCDDLHNVRQTIGKVFKGKWVSTGISKGGSTCTYYRAYYPNDVDASVAYVAPISRGTEDGRHEKFLNKKVGDKQRRAAMHEIMHEFMRRKPDLLPKFKDYCDEHNIKFRLPIDQIYDYEVMEYEFSMWQWGTSTDDAPKKFEGSDKWLQYLIKIVGPEYFASEDNAYLPFYFQAIHELGYYGYSTKHIKENRSVKSTEGYLKQLMALEDWKDVQFDPTVYKYTCQYLKKNDPTHIFIYGENDPWTASGVAGWLNCSKKQNMKIYIQPNGSHQARIKTLPAKMQNEVTAKLSKWVNY